MKTKTIYLSFLYGAFQLFVIAAMAQAPEKPTEGGELSINPEKTPCISDVDRNSIWNEINGNIQQLKTENNLAYDANRPELTKFSWPIRQAEGVSYNQIWGISNYVDHQPGSGIEDYNCDFKTYNGHMGTDIYLWPFSWYAMDQYQAENIAAADGQIIAKHDGYDDRSCEMNQSMWNAVYLQHADGTITWYGHMKKGSLTSKNVGDMVSKGEFLGNTGSSGSSTGPHLHFEVYDSGGNLIDPYQGNCNSLNADSWWENQLPHTIPTINAALTHSNPPVFPDCPQQETPNFKDNFAPNETALFAIYLTDQVATTSVFLEIIKPDGTHAYGWTHVFEDNYAASYWYWTVNLTGEQGEWKWRATYQGQSVSHHFTVGVVGIEANKIANFKIYPNPAKDIIYLQADSKIIDAELLDVFGRVISRQNNFSGIENIPLKNLSSGIYFIKAKDDLNRESLTKVLIE